MSDPWLNDDVVMACADLAERAGARDFEFGYVHEGVPVEEAGWYAHVNFKGARVIVQDHTSPTNAAFALAQKLLANGLCRCGERVTLTDFNAGCRWRLMGPRWEPGCAVDPIEVNADDRGDLDALKRAIRNQLGVRAPTTGPPVRERKRGKHRMKRK